MLFSIGADVLEPRPHSAPLIVLPPAKRPKIDISQFKQTISALFDEAHKITQNQDAMMDVDEVVAKKESHSSCPCGHLHGPGQGDDHDHVAVGLTNNPLFRGPS